ncbi:MAG: 2-hydroxychromene-2-carboxylate isomerase [Chakrabartia sp.]
MTKTIEFIFDFASPNAYLVHHALPDLIARTGASLVYTPCLLGGIFRATNNKAPMVQFADIPAKMAYERLEMMRFIAAHNITKFRMNPYFPINTLLIMRAAIVAAQDGMLGRYIDAVLSDMWEAGRNMGDPEVVAAALNEHGFDGFKMIERTQDQGVKDTLVANTEQAVARGAFGIPTFFVGDQMFFGKERLDQVAAALA